MSYENPTSLRVGMAGVLNGWRVRVAGRVVMGMEDGRDTYYWSEFNLVDAAGTNATLVFEETEAGPEWKLFKTFEPLRPMTAAEAAAKQVGDKVDLDGTPAEITLVDESHVCHVEGAAPEGVEVGDAAKYFNVDTGQRMLVASWSGNEIEFYEGLDVPAESIATAFGLPAETARHSSALSSGSETRSGVSTATKAAFVGLALVILFAVFSCVAISRRSRSANYSSAPRPVAPAPPTRLAIGAQGVLGDRRYSVAHQARIAIARTAGRYERQEYELLADSSERALLINGLTGGARQWHLLFPIHAPEDLGPYEAAARKAGAAITVDGRAAQVAELFQSQARSVEPNAGTAAWPSATQYGFLAQAGDDWLIARWTESGLQLYGGQSVPETQVLAALGTGPALPRK